MASSGSKSGFIPPYSANYPVAPAALDTPASSPPKIGEVIKMSVII